MAAPLHNIPYTPRAVSAPAHATPITPSDTTVFSPALVALYVGGAGDLSLLLAGDDTAVTIKAPPIGTVLNLAIQKVMAATTATLLVGFW